MSKSIGGGHQQMNGGVSIAYSGVHQAYQLALAAFELGELTRFYCSIYSGSGKWGGVLARLIGSEQLRNRRIDGLCGEKVYEHPWPLLTQRLCARLARDRRDDWLFANDWFDRWVARQLPRSGARLFIGVETCAAASFAVARDLGMLRILDSPGIPARFLDNMALEAAERFGLPLPRKWHVPAMAERKAKEIELADAILVCSKLQARLLGAAGKKARLLPLGVDATFWQGTGEKPIAQGSPLQVLFVGRIGLRKGVPYLLEALSSVSAPLALTMIGAVDEALRPLLKHWEREVTLKPPCGKLALREQYRAHDLLILPSLGDSFGSVALEAMACGLPVIVTENCGVPVPDPSWRVPAHDSDAIARRLGLYADDRALCREHGLIAAAFARQFTPARYRDNVKKTLREFFEPASSPAFSLEAASVG